MSKPPCLVWLPADYRQIGEEGQKTPFMVLGEQYARAVRYGAGAQPVMFAMAKADEIPALLELVDGVFLTGSPSNVHPSHFDEPVADPTLPLDAERDALTLALVRACVAQEVPLLGVCRGFQEINVALGGSLHQRVHQIPGLADHREPAGQPVDVQFASGHEVSIVDGSVFAQWAGATHARVNSLHGQGIARLAPDLSAQVFAPDGLIEGFEISSAATFAYAVQWHPEWRFWETPFYAAILKAFGQACAQRQAARLERSGPKKTHSTLQLAAGSI